MPRIEDVSPDRDRTTINLPFARPNQSQSPSGRGLTVIASADGRRVYAGNNAGVWRSNDGGENWIHMTRPQPKAGTTAVPGALLSLDVYDLAICPTDPNIVLAATGRDIRSPSKSGIYRSTDGGVNWTLVQFLGRTGRTVATDEPSLFFAAGGDALLKSNDFGATWSILPLAPFTPGTDKVFRVVVGPKPEASRRIYALGTRLWFSLDGGAHWQADPAFPPASGPFPQPEPPNNAAGRSARTIAIHPSNPQILYVTATVGNSGAVWKGTFGGAGFAWVQLTSLTAGLPGTTLSGTNYIHAHQSPTRLYLFTSDGASTQISFGDSVPTAWTQFDDPNFMHLDPHAIWMTPDFRHHTEGGRGRIWQVNDGGVYFSTDGAKTWKLGRGFSTLSPINVAVSARNGRLPAICLGTGDNGAFFSSSGGRNWTSADYQQGDNDAAFVDPMQPGLLYVFAPRGPNAGLPTDVRLVLYIATGSSPLDAAQGTSQKHHIISAPLTGLAAPRQFGWNCVSFFSQQGYRPLILTLPNETPRVGGDFICIRFAATGNFLMRTTQLVQQALTAAALGQPTVFTLADWTSTATSETAGTNVFQQGPVLPNPNIGIVQASGGHNTPVFYVGDKTGLWRWTNPLAAWQQLVPNAGNPPQRAVRFFVDPYRPGRIFLIDNVNVWRTRDDGANWAIDAPLQAALTENGAFPVALVHDPIPNEGTPSEELLQDMVFDPTDPAVIIAVSPAGVFITIDDSATWTTMASFNALQTRVMSTFLDTTTDPLLPSLYVSTPFRGLLKITYPTTNRIVNFILKLGVGDFTDQAKKFEIFRKFPNPFIAAADPAHPDTTKPEGKLQKALTDTLTAKASAAGHTQILKTPRDPNAADFLDIFPIPFTIADVSGARPFPVAHYNGDEVDFVASEAKLAVLLAAFELRNMVRRFANDLNIISAPVLLDALKLLAPRILNAVPLIKAAKDVRGVKLPITDLQRLPNYARILEINDSAGPNLQIDFKGAIAAEVDPKKKKKDYDFGRSLFDMVVNSGDETATNCIDALGYAYINGVLEAGGFFERPTPADPKTFRGIWVGGNYAVERIRGVLSVNDGPAQFGGTTKQFARLLALIRAGVFADPADPDGDLMRSLLNKAQTGTFKTALTFGGVFTYQMNSLGFGQLGINDPTANRVASEAAMLQRANAKAKTYVVAWQNMEFAKVGNDPPIVVTRGGHVLYSQADIIEIITKTVAAYE